MGNHLADQSKSTFDDLIKESDSNKDGKISYEEFKNMMKKLIWEIIGYFEMIK